MDKITRILLEFMEKLTDEFGLAPSAFFEIYNFFLEEIKKSIDVDDIYFSDYKFWFDNHDKIVNRINVKLGFLKPELSNKSKSSDKALKFRFSKQYFYNLTLEAKKQKAVAINKSFSKCIASFLGYSNFEELINHKLSDKAKEDQLRLINFKRSWSSKPEIKEDQFSIFYNTNWWLYFYGYPTLKNDVESLVKLKFEIYEPLNEDIIVRIQNTPNSERHHNFIGFIDLQASTKGILVCNLKSELTGSLFLHMKIRVDHNPNQKICMGMYTDHSMALSIFGGTILLKKAGAEFESSQPTSYRFDSKELKKNDELSVIANYFKEKRKNFIRIPSKINSITDLKAWMEHKS